MARLIDADELRSDMYEYVFPITSNNLMGAADAYYRILHLLDDMPTVDAVEVVHGEWIDNGVPESVLSKCSVCGYSCGSSSFNFCPNCGAKMDGGIGTAEDICKTTNIPCIKCNPGPCEHRKKG